jgi:hypothetical protein
MAAETFRCDRRLTRAHVAGQVFKTALKNPSKFSQGRDRHVEAAFLDQNLLA